jgi:NAD(P)-dependent dehydrogenase (short-subunit alcohol dehydrogenase family)
VTAELTTNLPGPPPEGGGGPVLVVTGTGGMGAAIARRLGAGRTVVLADIDAGALGAVGSALRKEGHRVVEVRTDVSDAAAVARLADAASGYGRLRALVHTAGVSPVQAPARRIIEVDLIGTANVLDAFEPHVQRGSVAVCIASGAGTLADLTPAVEAALALAPTTELAALPVLNASALSPSEAYMLAKRASQLRVQAAAPRWRRRGGRVVSISPGFISTEMGRQELNGPSGASLRQLIESTGIERFGTPDDIAAAAEFLIGSAASFITGTDLLIDGGAVATLRFAASASADSVSPSNAGPKGQG